MKIDIDKKLLKYALYITITAITIYIVFAILFNIGTILGTTFDFIVKILSLIKPLLIAILITYILFPITRSIENFLKNNKIYKIKNNGTSRALSIIFSYLAIIGIILGLLCGIYFMIGGQLSKNISISNIVEYISTYLNTHSLSNSSISLALENLNLPFLDAMEDHIVEVVNFIQNYITNNIGKMASFAVSIGSGVATFFIALIISIYLLKDHEYFINLWDKLYYLIFRNSKIGKKINYVFSTIHEVFGRFIRGQLLEAFFVGVLSAIALSIVGIDYAFVIGIIVGLSNLIPYVGPIVGTILAAIMGLLSGTPIKIVYAIIAMIIVQQIDNNLLAPKIVGNSVGLHAVFTMLAILIGGNIGGLLGMLLAVPLAASFKVLFNNWYTSYMKKENLKK
ncbi:MULTISPECIES: AI-2E family transporter [Clostridium]|uniref:Membrane protein n=1 Tax=Clostridium botulinum (strain Eklund 17B / Type B) TaxID=935198 RepID=B2TRJ3_CLOBB|nr:MULTISPECIES: AI-2E family transporter [Clostridium]ACD23856.1 putative membrane protein [Clostridium botulinum B str. Eklund 17B (NRP)]MBN1052568.1 AI-2E family transporter [Clostridium botulinum]MBN1068288.1 AI-2E family transporter [Clostridium botulinum]MBY6975832.1 AI-2E family transporter [Clostridium botulinum]MBY7000255.1 AI-2E family transporter [Clostridium botulinum]